MGRKKIRQKQLIQLILNEGRIPETSVLAKRFHVTQRTIQKDLNDVAGLIPDTAIEEIRRKLMFELNKRVSNMKEHNLIKLAEFFLAKKTEARVEAKVEGKIKVDRGEEIEKLLRRLEEQGVFDPRSEGVSKEDSSGEPVDTEG